MRRRPPTLRGAAGLLAALVLCLPAGAWAQDALQVVKVVLAEPKLEGPGEQLVQVSLRNTTGKPVRAGLRVEIRFGRTENTGIAKQRVVVIPPFAEQRVFFPLQTPAAPGNYTARVVVLTANFRRHLLTGNPEFYSPFVVTAGKPVEEPTPGLASAQRGSRRPASFSPPPGLSFEKPDLLWENFSVEPPNALIGEPVKVRADLRNVGGDIARDVTVALQVVNVRLPTRVVSLTTSEVAVLAPGEKIEMEFEHAFDDSTLLGEYRLSLVADSKNAVTESDEKNNKQETRDPVRLSTIRQVFPEPGFAFEEAGLFLFRWDSRKYNEFKVQVGTEETFEDPQKFFDIPQGEKWSAEHEVVPLEGELPGMLKGLLGRAGGNQAFWRVVGRIAGTDQQGHSLVRGFRLNITEPAEQAGPRTQPGGATPPPARPSAATTPPPQPPPAAPLPANPASSPTPPANPAPPEGAPANPAPPGGAPANPAPSSPATPAGPSAVPPQ